MSTRKDTPYQHNFFDVKFNLVDILESLPMGVFVVGDDEEVVYANAPAENMFGNKVVNSEGFTKGIRCGDFLTCSNRLESSRGCGFSSKCMFCPLLKTIRAMIAGEGQKNSIGTIELTTEDDSNQRYIKFHATPLNLNGKTKILISLHDISQEKNKDIKLTESEQRFQAAFMGNPDAVVICTRNDGTLRHVNQAALDMFGYSREEVVGKSMLTTRLWAALDDYEQILRDLEKKGEIKNREVELHHRTGIKKLISVSARSIILNGEKHLLFTWQDITKRKEAEQEILRLKERLEIATDSAQIGVWDLDLTDNTLIWDRWMCRIYGVDADNFTGSLKNWKERVHPKDLNKTNRAVSEAITGRHPFNTQFRIVRPNGTIRHIRAFGRVVVDASGRPCKMTGANIDMTDRKHEEARLERALQQTRLRHEETSALLKAAQSIPFCKTFEDAARIIFESSKQAVGAASGYIALLSKSGDSNEVLFLDAGGLPCDVDPDLPMPVRGLRELAYRRRQVVYDNNFDRSQWVKYLPPGHVKLYNVLFAPLNIRDHSVGIIGMANKPEGFNKRDVQVAAAFADLAAVALTYTVNQQALRESEERFRGIFEHMASGVAIYDAKDNGADFVFKDFNTAAENITRIKREAAMGNSLLSLFPYMDETGFLNALKYVWKTGQDKHLPPFYYKDDVREGWRENRIYKLPSGEVVALFDDVTESKEAEIELRKKTNLLEGILDSITDIIGVQLPDHTMLRYNKTGYELLGLAPDAAKGKKCYEIIGQTKPCEACPARLAARSGTVETVEKYFPKLKKHFMCTCNPILDENGETALIIEQLTDITEKKKLDEKLKQAQKMESIGNLAGGIAHDFNNILSPIVGMSEMLLEDLPQGSLEWENAEEIFKAGNRGSELVNQILAFSRQSEHKLTPTRIQHILKEVLKLSRATIPSYIEIEQDIQPDCGLVMTDPTQIHQVVMNIVTNAFHAVEAEGGTISIRLKETDITASETIDMDLQPGRYVELSVADTGHGMSAELMEKIFDPYFTTKTQGKGTGLGLAVVYGIIQEHKGKIKVHSEIGRGTTFNVYLPLMEKSVEADGIAPAATLPNGRESILLVDDEQAIANLEKQILERLGYQVTMRVNSIETLEVFKAKPESFDLIISDMTMPNMTGDQLAREIKAIRPDIPIIICTGFSEKINKEKAAQLGIDSILMKPVVKSEMAETIRKILDKTAP